MLRSLFTAVTGVRAHQTMLDVTGNNISNANTVGFKKDFTIFSDIMYQSNKYASGASENRGGVNPAQVGLGVSVSAIETIHTQGSAQYTGNPSDMMIQGTGFFVYKSGNVSLFSRSGATVRDANSDLVQSGTGYYLQGYEITEGVDGYERASDLSNVNIPLGKKIEAKATTEVKYQCNLNAKSNAYLPYGFADIPFNSVAGWGADNTKEAVVKINGADCKVSILTHNLGETANASGATGYMTMEIKEGNNTLTITMNMTGIDDEGRPTFAATSATTPQQLSTGSKLTGIGLDPDTTNSIDKGILRLKSGSKTVFEYNIYDNMNYKSFTASVFPTGSTTRTPTKFIAEFNEQAAAAGSDLAATSSHLYIWAPTGQNNAMTQYVLPVYFNADGTFSSIDDSTLRALGLGVEVSDDGTYLNIFQGTYDTTNNVWTDKKSISQINIGGHHQTKQTIYDSEGGEHTLEVNFKKVTENRWRWEAFIVGEGDIIPQPNTGEIEFTGEGLIKNVISTGSGGQTLTFDEQNPGATINVPFSLIGRANAEVFLNFGGGEKTTAGDVLMGVTQFESETTTKAVYQDGYQMGVLENYSIGQDGTITGSYSNGKNIPLYRVAIATFANEQGLDKVGDTMFRETVNSGYANIDPAQVNGKGTIVAQTLEMSNVDLTEEFTHLIISQRGFQANTRVITTSDQILEEVVNLKR